MKIVQTPTFSRHIKKLYRNQKKDLDAAIEKIKVNPLIGEGKKGDLSGVRVFKFRMVKELTLLAYCFDVGEICLILLVLGTHENFYRDLKSS